MIKLFFHFLTKVPAFQDRCVGELKGFSTKHEVKLSALSGPLSKSQLLAYAEEKRSQDQFKYGDMPLVGRFSEPAKLFQCVTFYDRKGTGSPDEVVTVNLPKAGTALYFFVTDNRQPFKTYQPNRVDQVEVGDDMVPGTARTLEVNGFFFGTIDENNVKMTVSSSHQAGNRVTSKTKIEGVTITGKGFIF